MKLSVVGPEELGTRDIGKMIADSLEVPFIDGHRALVDIAGPNIFSSDEADPSIIKTLTQVYKRWVFATIPRMIVPEENLVRLHRFGPIVYLKSQKDFPNTSIDHIELVCKEKIALSLSTDGQFPDEITQEILRILTKWEHSIFLPPDRRVKIL